MPPPMKTSARPRPANHARSAHHARLPILTILPVVAWLSAALLPTAAPAQTARCINPALNLVVLGSGGPELNDRRASTGYLRN